MGKRHIKDSVRHELYARSGNQCAFPGCSSLLFEDGKNGKANKGKICHIEGLNPESARYNPSSTDDERNSIDNLPLSKPPIDDFALRHSHIRSDRRK